MESYLLFTAHVRLSRKYVKGEADTQILLKPFKLSSEMKQIVNFFFPPFELHHFFVEFVQSKWKCFWKKWWSNLFDFDDPIILVYIIAVDACGKIWQKKKR